ncbi:DUF4440 domain-containing protein [Myxosarcina sp. GI1]|uniref:nuclear transport factor 2 family protein n=1 Tax=Myxosarcina sp. GI1 TaxID=1541065 RepID=UPI00068D7289|nr:nuclear transport factor 2 family protein [Myxosarcina sp. GI1]
MKISDEDFNELKDLEEKLWKAETRFDKNWMNKVLSSDFFEIGRSGKTYTREMTICCEPSEIPADLPLSNFKVSLIREDIAQVTYISSVNYQDGLEKGLRSSLWSKQSGEWKLEFHQGTPLYSAE